MITINGVDYIPLSDSLPSPLQIIVLDRGWVIVGHTTQDEGYLTIRHASVVRRWGTTSGLGEIAALGPLKGTVLDPAGTVRAPIGSVVFTLDCVEKVWLGALASPEEKADGLL